MGYLVERNKILYKRDIKLFKALFEYLSERIHELYDEFKE